MTNDISPYNYREGLVDGIPIALGYFSVSIGFGITSVSLGIQVMEALMISMTNLTSAGQLAGVGIIAACGSLTEMILTQLVINLRYSLMSISISQKLDGKCNLMHRCFMAFGMTDEIFAVASGKKGTVGPKYFYGLMTLPYIGWALGTLTGAVAGSLLPEDVISSMGIMMYAMFVAILVPTMKTDKRVIAVVVMSAFLSCMIAFLPFLSFISSGFSIIISALLSSLLCALLFPVKEDENET